MDARDENARLVVAIDGPSGSGKSSVSKEVARRFNLAYLDTGAIPRRDLWWCLHTQVGLSDSDAIVEATVLFPWTGTDPNGERITVDGQDVRSEIRGDDVTNNIVRDRHDRSGS